MNIKWFSITLKNTLKCEELILQSILGDLGSRNGKKDMYKREGEVPLFLSSNCLSGFLVPVFSTTFPFSDQLPLDLRGWQILVRKF